MSVAYRTKHHHHRGIPLLSPANSAWNNARTQSIPESHHHHHIAATNAWILAPRPVYEPWILHPMQTSHLATSAGMVASEGSGHLRSSDDHRAAPAANSYVMSTTTLTTPQRSIPKAPGRTSLHSALHPPPPPPPSSTVDPTRAADQSPSTFGKQAAQSITPFLTKHIPTQYAPLGAPNHSDSGNKNSNTKYCYRHRPDLKCRRQANEPSMDQLQKVQHATSIVV